ncbi:MAG: glycoside hydrolase domain-containing protein [Phycisphaerae bacterium]
MRDWPAASMILSHPLRYLGSLFLFVMAIAAAAGAEEPSGGLVVLDTAGVWRLHQTFSPPVIQSDKGASPLLFGRKWLDQATEAPPQTWTNADFDDSAWLRGPARIAWDTPYLSRLCLRGKFTVTDTASVKGLALTLAYYGGAVVYVNGKEVLRKHMPGDIKDGNDAPADGYPDEAFVDGQGGNLGELGPYSKQTSAEDARRIALRTRLAEAAVPPSLLRKGTNVVAIQIVRAPYGRAMEKFRDKFDHPSVKRMLGTKELPTITELKWGTCSIRHVQLTAGATGGIVQNAVRPGGFQVWNSEVLASDFDQDFGSSAEDLRPMCIAGARNGSFSGKVVVSSGKAIKSLRAAVSDLKGPGTIPASAVRIRYGIAWGEDAGAVSLYPLIPQLLGALAENPPAEIPVREGRASQASLKTPGQPKPVPGAVTSVWVTVDIPADARPGRYTGTVTITADGQKPAEVPVHLTVEDWKLPDPQDCSTWVELIQSPDTLVKEYGLERWSDRHFQMIAQSMKHLNRIGSRVIYVPVICHTNIGNEESMVRWIRKPDGRYEWDFSIMDKYLDTAVKFMGKPKVVCFWVWEKFMFPTLDDPKTYEVNNPRVRPNDNPDGTNDGIRDYIGKGPMVTVLDPTTGKVKNEFLPYLLSPESKAIWKPLFEELSKRMQRRGLRDAMMIGTASDIVPRKEHFAFFNEVAPGIPWVSHTHNLHNRIFEAAGAKLGYYTTVFNVAFPLDPSEGRRHGWQEKDLHAHLLRNWSLDSDFFPMTTWRHMAELNIAGSQRGIGRLGADFWRVLKNPSGSRVGRIYEACPEGNWRSNDICTSFLAPSPDGPVATTRYEMMREGVQECEARITIERALVDEGLRKKLWDDLAARCQETLDERTRCMIRGISTLQLTGYWRQLAPLATHESGGWWNKPGIAGNAWFISSGWQDRTRKLFALAAEVQRPWEADR